MHRPFAAPFQGSMPAEAWPVVRLARLLDLCFGATAILGAGAIWTAACVGANQPDPASVLKISSLFVLTTSLFGLWLIRQAGDGPRDAVSRIYDAAFRRMAQHGTQAVHSTPCEGSYRGLAGLIGDLALLARKLQAKRSHDGQAAEATCQALAESRQQAQRIATRIRQQAGTLAEAAAEIDLASERVACEAAAARQSVETTHAVVSRAADKIAGMAGSVRTITAGAQQMASLVVGLSQIAQGAHNRVAELDDRSTALVTAMDHIEHALQMAASLGHSISVEAAAAGVPGKNFAVIASELQDVAGRCGPALEQAVLITRHLASETMAATRRVGEIGDLIVANREVGEAIGHAVQQQGEDITHVLNDIYEAREGFATLRAGVESVTRAGIVGSGAAESLRLAARDLPTQADSVACLLRGLPDFAPSTDH